MARRFATERKNRIKPSTAAALALVVFSALNLFVFDAGKAPAEESWLKIEEEKPVYGRPQAPKSPKADNPKPKAKGNMAEKEARLKRYLRRFIQAMAGAQQCVDDRGNSYEKLEKESAKVDAANRSPAITELRPVLSSSLAVLNAYGELVKKDARFTPVDPGRNAAIREKGDELVKLGDAMCKTAKQWAKSNSGDQRIRLKKDLDRMRQEVMRKRSALKDELNSMISLLKPIYKRLGVAYKEMTAERKKDLKQSYEIIISSILEAHKWRAAMDRKRQPFEDELQKALDAAAAIRGILDRNPKLLTQSERNNIRQQVAPERTTSQLRTDFNSQQRKLERDPAKTIEASHSELAKDPGMPMVKVALASKTLALIYSASGDTFSKGMKDVFDNMQRTKDTLTEIRKRSLLAHTEWRRSSDRLTEYWACVNKSLKQKVKRYFSGIMKQTFSAAVVKLHKPCRSKKSHLRTGPGRYRRYPLCKEKGGALAGKSAGHDNKRSLPEGALLWGQPEQRDPKNGNLVQIRSCRRGVVHSQFHHIQLKRKGERKLPGL